MNEDMQQYICYQDYPVGNLNPATSLNQLSEQEKQYAIHLSLAAYASLPILLEQVSSESMGIFEFSMQLYKPFTLKQVTFEDVDAKCGQAQLKLIFKQINEYFGQFVYQGGNFQGYGDKKFIPRCSTQQFKDFIELLKKHFTQYSQLSISDTILHQMYDLEGPKIIQFWENGGQTQYYSKTISQDDVKEFDKLIDIKYENTTITETPDKFFVEIASIEEKEIDTGKAYKSKPVILRYGKYSAHLKKIIPHLQNAILETKVENQKNMLKELILFYQNGDMTHHLKYSEYWVYDASPTVETYQGFIETYRDPCGVRAEMEAFVAVIDPVTSSLLEKLLQEKTSQEILQSLPVPEFLHRQTFVPPSYKAIDIVAFVCCGMPIGINIPNYDDIRQKIGYKNVTLQNVISARSTKTKDIQYLQNESDKLRIIDNSKKCTDAEVALHELFGHGSCKLLFKQDFEQLSQEQRDKHSIKGYYLETDTFYGKFKEIQSAFEECRAEVTAHFLIQQDIVLKLFDVQNKKDFSFCSVFSMVLAGVYGLMQYDQKSKKWLQAHSRANFAIFRNVLLNTDCIKLKLTDDYLYIEIDETKLDSIVAAHGKLVYTLNTLKAGADYDGGVKLFDELTNIDQHWENVRRIALLNKKPRAVMLPGCIQKKNEGYEMLNPLAENDKEAFETACITINNCIQAGL